MTGSGSAAEVFRVFLRLGLTSFGGPVAHIGYFREEFVTRRAWLSDGDYAELVALCQFLPGPASSQVGFALGLMRAGWMGAVAAFLGFTLPSALVMVAVAMGAGLAGLSGVIAALKLVAVAVVAQAVIGMARSLCPDGPRATIAVAAVALLAVLSGPWAMVAVIAGGALAGAGLRLDSGAGQGGLCIPVGRPVALGAAALFALGLLGLPLLAGQGAGLALADAMFRAGALVFGGGHVVLPLLQAELVATGQVSDSAFLAGYAAAQAIPGPLFTFASYLGALGGATAALIATLAIFAPGFLLLIAALPFWQALRALAPLRAGMAGANAAVVGILGAALYDPVFTSAVASLGQFAFALACFVGLHVWRLPAWAVVLSAGVAGALGLAG
ncbi:chromate efflux transporter [Roseibaca sp. Y0-43]|uniref:chromate efflux transporter n=1 Tax=Roseibaca sp. Y0-43 TaxID=2816854 RepID=UPI001D0CCA75|nr:chromate efflux transporter [Roseibaca sp. Y0-43]